MGFDRRRFLALAAGASTTVSLAGCSSESSTNVDEEVNFDDPGGDEFVLGAYLPLAVHSDGEGTGNPALVTEPDVCNFIDHDEGPSDHVDAESIIVPPNSGTSTDQNGLEWLNFTVPVHIVWRSTLSAPEQISVLVDIDPIDEALQKASVFQGPVSDNPVQGYEALVPLDPSHEFELSARADEIDDIDEPLGPPKIQFPHKLSDGSSAINGLFANTNSGGFMLPVTVSLQVDFTDYDSVPFDKIPKEDPHTTTMLLPAQVDRIDDIKQLLDTTDETIDVLENSAEDWASSAGDAVQITSLAANRDDLSQDQLEAGVRVSMQGVTAFDDELLDQAARYQGCARHMAGPTLGINTSEGEATQSDTPTPTPTATQTATPTSDCTVPASQNKLQPGYDASNTGYNAAATPRSAPGERPDREWQVEFEDQVTAAALAEGDLFVAAGGTVHRFEACTGRNHTELVTSDGTIENVLLDGDRLYVGWRSRDETGYLAAYSDRGQTRVGGQRLGADLRGTTIHEGDVYAYVDGGLISSSGPQLSRYSGDLQTERWLVDTQSNLDFPPAVGDDVIVAAGASYVYGYDTDGDERWSRGPGGYSHSAPILDGSQAVVAPEDEVQRLDTADGSVVERAEIDWQPFSSGVLTDQRVYYGTGEGLLVLDREPLEVTARIATSATVWSRPVVSETMVYVIDEAGQLTMIDRESLETVDQLQLRLDDEVRVDPFLAAGQLFTFGARSVAVYR